MGELPTDTQVKLEELYDAQRLLRWLEPIILGSLLIEAWAVIEIFDNDRGYAAGVLSAALATGGLVWAFRARRQRDRLSRELGVILDG